MKRFFLITSLLMAFTGCGHAMEQDTVQPLDAQTSQSYNMNITINGQTMSATMVDNSSTDALRKILESEGSLTFTANDYGGFEKVGSLGHNLPENNERIVTSPGDIILYMGNSMCLYYAQNSWNFTRLGRINYNSLAELKSFLNAGGGNITITLTLDDASSVKGVRADSSSHEPIYDLNGKVVSEQDAKNGVFVVKGKKVRR